jgi:rubrerythrin
MTKEQDAALAGLETSLQMEIDGKEFYLKAAKASGNKLGRELLKKLAAEEDIHRGVFKNIYNTIKSKKNWPDVTFSGDSGKALKSVFAQAMESMKKSLKPLPAELDAVSKAMEMENKTLDFYNERKESGTYDAEKQLYASLAGQEYQHHQVLQDYYEFLKNPEQWYVKSEHSSVDGG